MKNKISQLIKCFNAWLIRVNEWFIHPSPLSLLISLLAPCLFACFLIALEQGDPEYFSRFLQMSAGESRVPYETWLIIFFACIYGLVWSTVNWIFDCIKWIVSLFRKSSAPADDK